MNHHKALSLPLVCGEVELLELLIEAGANPSTPDIHGAYPLHYAAQVSCLLHSALGLIPCHELLPGRLSTKAQPVPVEGSHQMAKLWRLTWNYYSAHFWHYAARCIPDVRPEQRDGQRHPRRPHGAPEAAAERRRRVRDRPGRAAASPVGGQCG